MSTGGSVDERIRAVLDLGDSSGAVKALDQEIQKLLEDFKKQTELFEAGKIKPKDYAESVAKLKSELGGLKTAISDLGSKSPEASAGLETLSRSMFALERGVSALTAGTGLAKAANLLESVIGFAKGPAGIGIALGLVANTIDNVAPKIKESWDKLWNQFSDADIKAKREALAEQAKQLRSAVSGLEIQPKPGLEYQQAERDTKLRNIFAGQTAPDLISGRLYNELRRHPGAVISDLQPEEREEIRRQRDFLYPGAAQKREFEQGVYPGLMQTAISLGQHLGSILNPRAQIEAQQKIAAIKNQAARRTADKLIVDAQQPGPMGRTARQQLLDLATRFPGILKPEDMTNLQQIIKDEEPSAQKESMEKLAEEKAKAEALEYKGPPPPVYPEFRQHGMAPRVPYGLIPGAEEAASLRRQEQERGARGPVAGPNVLPPELGGPRRPRYRRTQSYTGDVEAQQAVYGEALKSTHQNQVQALKLEQQGLATHGKTQAVVFCFVRCC